jgi:hypothetical protein
MAATTENMTPPGKYRQSPPTGSQNRPSQLIHMCVRTQTNALPLVHIDCPGKTYGESTE